MKMDIVIDQYGVFIRAIGSKEEIIAELEELEGEIEAGIMQIENWR